MPANAMDLPPAVPERSALLRTAEPRGRWAGAPVLLREANSTATSREERHDRRSASLPQGRIGILTVNNPPVNALAAAVRDGIKEGVEAFGDDPNIDAIVLIGGGRTFIAGADIREFGKPPKGANLNDVIATMENCPKIVVAALHGTPLGGGLETALGAHYRVALPSTRVGLPEVHLGLLPGAGGTQRLPRLTGAKYALDAILSGRHIPAPEARKKGIVDAIVEGRSAGRRGGARPDAGGPERAAPARARPHGDAGIADLFKETEKAIARRARGFKAPWSIIKCVQAAVELPFDEGLKRERELFVELLTSPESAAQRYYFFAEREAAKVLDVPADTPQREIKTAGIVGAGTMGGGIAMNFANAGIPVTLLEVKQEALDRGLKTIRTNYENTAKRGGMKAEDVDKRMALIKPTLSYDDLKDADVIIEAVFETMEVKEGVFKKLDEVAKPGAMLATNTSGLDVNQIANYTKRPGDVIGMHFFSPANVMKLLENVRGKATQKDVIATVMSLSKKIGKIPVLVGVCEGFVGNRMLRQRGVQSSYMLEEGALPQQIDKVIYDFGFPMGPFAMSDLAGNDVGWRIRQGKKEKEQRNVRYTGYIADAICELGRFGQKTGAGYYKYNLPDRTPIPDPEVEKIIEETSKKLGITRRAISDQEILERCLYPMVNEGAKILAEGMAQRSLDIDVIWVNGYGWPVYRGGPMWWADNVVGLKTIHDALLRYRDASGDPFWEPAPLLEKLVQEGKKFSTV